MLTLENATEELEAQYSVFKTLSREIFEQISAIGQHRQLGTDVDLLTLAPEGAVIYINEGYFRLIYGNKVVRLYSEEDLVETLERIEGAVLTSEFASDVTVFDWRETLALMGSNQELLFKWFSLMELENRINLALCAHLVDERIQPSLDLRNYKDEELIIEEGTASEEIYEMITGQATVLVGDTEVGIVETGEIFGEMSALAECPRTAAVKADGPCCVRVVKQEDFFKLIEVDRHLSATIAKTLAKRIIELNRRLAEK